MGERGAHAGQIGGGDEDRALAEIKIDDVVDRAVQRADVAQQMTDRAVAVAGLGFRAVDRLVHRQPPAGGVGEPVEDQTERAVARDVAHDAGDRDRAGIHHRIEGPIGIGIEEDGVEGVAARLDADPLQHRVTSGELQRQAIHEGLRHRLDRERKVGVADRVELADLGCDRDPEPLRIDRGELRDVIGERPVGVSEIVCVGCREDVFDLGRSVSRRDFRICYVGVHEVGVHEPICA